MAAARACSEEGAIVNAMSVDVEDYFQVSAFDRVVDRNAWDRARSGRSLSVI